MGMPHGHAAMACSTDKQNGYGARTCGAHTKCPITKHPTLKMSLFQHVPSLNIPRTKGPTAQHVQLSKRPITERPMSLTVP